MMPANGFFIRATTIPFQNRHHNCALKLVAHLKKPGRIYLLQFIDQQINLFRFYRWDWSEMLNKNAGFYGAIYFGFDSDESRVRSIMPTQASAFPGMTAAALRSL